MSAQFGAKDTKIDITDYLKEALPKESLRLNMIGFHSFPDPVPRVSKHLSIRCRMDDQEYTLWLKNDSLASLQRIRNLASKKASETD